MTHSADVLARARAYLALAEKATPGPWHVDDYDEFPIVYGQALGDNPDCHVISSNKHDAAFIAASHEAADIIRALLTDRERERLTHAHLRSEIEDAVNRCSAENASNTPDWILAQFLMGCLAAFDTAVQQRETSYGRDARPSFSTIEQAATQGNK